MEIAETDKDVVSDNYITADMIEEEERLSQETKEIECEKARELKNETEERNKTEESDERDRSYKRLMHLLNCSQFYTEFLMKKFAGVKKKSVQHQEELENLNKPVNSNGEVKSTQSSLSSTVKHDTKVLNENTSSNIDKKSQSTVNVSNTNTSTSTSSEDVETSARKGKSKRKLPDGNSNLADYFDEETIKSLEKRVKVEEEPTSSNATVDEETYVTAFGHVVSKRQPLLFEGGILRDYQLDGLDWLKCIHENGMSGILADEMGLGKTLQTIAFVCYLIEMKCTMPFLIIGPLSTLPNWMIEFERFAPQIPVVLYHGSKEKRAKLQQKLRKKHNINGTIMFPVVVTSYEIPLRDSNVLRSIYWNSIIIDEGHRLKNYKCLLARKLKEYRAMTKILLTGTPLQNNLMELWSLLNFLLPEFFDDHRLFETLFDVSELERDEGHRKIYKQEQETKTISTLHQILQPFLLRRLKVDVALSIPPKKELLVYAPLTPIQRSLYEATVNRSIERLLKPKEDIISPGPDGQRSKRKCSLKKKRYGYYNSDDDSDEEEFVCEDIVEDAVEVEDKEGESFKVQLKMTNVSMMLRKITNHPYLVQMPVIQGEKRRELKVDENLVTKSGKMQVLDALLTKLKLRGHKVLIFSTFTMVLDLIEEYLVMRGCYKYCRIDGSTRLDERKQYIRAFNTDPDIFAFLLQTRTGGLGINLTGADTVIIYDSFWNPQVDLQAQDRCHRIGQTKPVVIYRFVTAGTVDEQIVERAAAKRKLEKLVIHKGKFRLNSFDHKNLMTLQELKELFESCEYQKKIESNGYVFSDEELEQLLDRSDMLGNTVKEERLGDSNRIFKVI